METKTISPDGCSDRCDHEADPENSPPKAKESQV